MIQSVIPTLTGTPAATLEALLQPGSGGPEVPDFAALLAQSAAPAGSSGGAVALPAIVAEPPTTQLPAAATGKSLPPVLPQVAAPVALAATLPVRSISSADEQPELAVAAPTAPLPAAPPARPRRSAKAAPTAARAPAAQIGDKANRASPANIAAVADTLPETSQPVSPAPAPESQPELPVSPTSQPHSPGGVAHPALAALPLQTPQTLPGQPARADLRIPPAVPVTPEPAPQAVEHAAPQAAFLRAAMLPPVPTPPSQPAPPPEPAPEPAPQAARTPILLHVEIAQPGALDPALKPVEKLLPVARQVASSQPAPAAITLANAAAPQLQAATAAIAPQLSASPRPHDFAALVDRLVAAREAVQPQGATLTVAHAEFGPVELRFRHEAHGLAVSLVSADPDFARAAAANPPVNLTVGNTATAAAAPAPTRDSAGSTGGSASGQPRGQQNERRDGPDQQSRHSPHRATTRDTAQRSGIFA